MSLDEDAFRYAVKNAFLHGGKADIGAVVGKLKALHAAAGMKEIVASAQAAVKKTNSLSLQEIEGDFRKFAAEGYELKPPEKVEGLKPLAWAEGENAEKVVTRFAPNPNGPFHLGNARAAILSHDYARKYGGEFFLRFDDTDPKVKKPVANAEQLFRTDLEWLGCFPDKVFFASDRLEIYYSLMRKIIGMGKAYVCLCDVEKWRELTENKKACPCRGKPETEQLALFEKMLSNDLKEGQAVLRIKTDLEHPDPSTRDWWAAKIVDRPEHPNPNVKGKFVWPSYNFASAVDDHELGVSLIIRGQEHAQNQTKQEFLYKYFGWKYPHSIHFGRVKLEGMVLSTSKIKAGIEAGEYSGWDDPRLGTIQALRRRGFLPETLRKAIIFIGSNQNDTTISSDALASWNRESLQSAPGFVFIQDPVRLEVKFCPATEAELDNETVSLDEGSQSFFVSKKELEKAGPAGVFRLKKAFNAKLETIEEFSAGAKFAGTHRLEPVVSWLLVGADIEVLMPDNSKVVGLVNEKILSQKIGSVVLLERFGFVRLDSEKNARLQAVFSHK
ncbi:MAG: glutamate--tRNA ligase [Candidatus Diapherotrites archaeon]|nr:glutamate--tRNA ligase [Candidatus Diapherotrites archaeon]